MAWTLGHEKYHEVPEAKLESASAGEGERDLCLARANLSATKGNGLVTHLNALLG